METAVELVHMLLRMLLKQTVTVFAADKGIYHTVSLCMLRCNFIHAQRVV